MATVTLNENGRVSAWSVEDIFEYPLENQEEIIEHFCGNMEDFTYEDGVVTFDPEEEVSKQRRIEELKQSLAETDYYAARSIEGLVECTTAEEIAQWAASVTEKYGNMISQRKEWRDELNSLTA